MTQRAYCDLAHPPGDAEADQWCDWYHRPETPRSKADLLDDLGMVLASVAEPTDDSDDCGIVL